MSGTGFFFSCVMMVLVGIVIPCKLAKVDLYKYGLSLLIMALVGWLVVDKPIQDRFPFLSTFMFYFELAFAWGGVYLLTSLVSHFKNQETN